MATPNMNLTLPVVSETPGPAWANQINSDLATIDLHDHTIGFGAPITPAAIAINENLPFSNYSATQLRSVFFVDQAGAFDPTPSAIYVSGGNLCFNDGTSTPIQITLNGNVNAAAGSITGMGGTSASASFNVGGGVFSFFKNIGTQAYGSMRHGPLQLFYGDAGVTTDNVTINVKSTTTTWSLTLPVAPPAQNGVFGLSSAGQGASLTPDSSITITTTQIKVAASGIQTANLANGSVTGDKLASVIQAVSASSGVYTVPTDGLWHNVTGNQVTLTLSTVRPIVLSLQNADPNQGLAYIETDNYFDMIINVSGANSGFTVNTKIQGQTYGYPMRLPPSCVSFLYFPTQLGATTFTVQVNSIGGSSILNRIALVAYQL